MAMTSETRGPAVTQRNRTQPQSSVRCATPHGKAAPRDLDTLRSVIADAVATQRAHLDCLRRLDSVAGEGAWRKELEVAMQKCDATRFWTNNALELLQREVGHGNPILPVHS